MRAVRPYWFEIFTILNFIALDFALRSIGFNAFVLLGKSFVLVGPFILLQPVVGIAVRVFRDRGYVRVVRSPQFISDVVRMVLFAILWTHVYGWLKVAVPALNRRLYDNVFWDLDQKIFFGLSPNVFFVSLFSNHVVLRCIDWSYAYIFVGSLFIGGAFFLTAPDRRLRAGFMNANTTMWLVGAWLYVAFPALDPCYRFPEVWLPLRPWLPQTQLLQRMLMTNYDNFVHLGQRPAPISLLLGLSAFPSMHVAFAFLGFLWMRGVSRAGSAFFAAATIIIFVGSLVTGWHYLVDAIAGLLLAAACYAAFRVLPERFRRHAPTD